MWSCPGAAVAGWSWLGDESVSAAGAAPAPSPRTILPPSGPPLQGGLPGGSLHLVNRLVALLGDPLAG